MKSWFILLCVTLSACSPINSVTPFNSEQADILIRETSLTKPAQQMIRLTLPDKEEWRKLTTSPAILIPRDETADHWQQKILTSIYPYQQQPGLTATTIMKDTLASLKQQCKHLTTTLLASTHQYLLYQIDIANCKLEKDQRQLHKLLMGSDAIYSIRYIAIKGYVTKRESKETAAAIKQARLVKNPAAVAEKPSRSLFSSSMLNE